MPRPVIVRVRRGAQARGTSNCIQCGRRPPVAGGVRCAECREVNRQARRRRESQLREAGLCLECQVGECETGQTRCAKCRARYKDRAKEAKRNGLCVSCYKRPANLPHVQCSICAETRRRSEKAKYRKRVAVGLCVECGKQPAVTKALCPLALATPVPRQQEPETAMRNRVSARGAVRGVRLKEEYSARNVSERRPGIGSKEVSGSPGLDCVYGAHAILVQLE